MAAVFRAKELTSIKLSTNPPKEIVDAGYKVVHNGKVKCWVGIGWVVEGEATQSDIETLPNVINE